jgi:hypothetical protein
MVQFQTVPLPERPTVLRRAAFGLKTSENQRIKVLETERVAGHRFLFTNPRLRQRVELYRKAKLIRASSFWVKRLLRNKLTRQFLTSGGVWTNDISSAESFADIRSVVTARQKLDLENVELLYLMGETPSDYDVIIPLGHY